MVMSKYTCGILCLLVFLFLFSMTVIARANKLVIGYPKKYCSEIVSQEYSTGGGKSVLQILEILCKDENGNYKGFLLQLGSAAGFLGYGRYTIPTVIEYRPYDGETLKKLY